MHLGFHPILELWLYWPSEGEGGWGLEDECLSNEIP